MQEVWRDIVGCKDYQVSDRGRVKSCARMVIRRDGYLMRVPEIIRKLHVVRVNGKPSSVRVTIRGRAQLVHNLVLKAFVGPCPPGQEGCHNDGNALRNILSNLRWDTREGNIADRYRHGRKRDWAPSIRRLQGRIFAGGYLEGAMGFTS